jgi:precorrin-6A synthase
VEVYDKQLPPTVLGGRMSSRPTRLNLIGIGTGNPDHLTLQAINVLNESDLVMIPHKGSDKSDLAELREDICAKALRNPSTRVVPFDMPRREAEKYDYGIGVHEWHAAIASVWSATIARELPDGGEVTLLVWGDPSLYDSTLRIAARLGLITRVVPGITAIQALAAAHGITLNEIGAPFTVTTGRRLREEGWPEWQETIIVMLDGHCAFQTLTPEGIKIWWGAYLGMAEEILHAGPLTEVGPEIVRLRAEARTRHGWIMDIYLLRRVAIR